MLCTKRRNGIGIKRSHTIKKRLFHNKCNNSTKERTLKPNRTFQMILEIWCKDIFHICFSFFLLNKVCSFPSRILFRMLSSASQGHWAYIWVSSCPDCCSATVVSCHEPQNVTANHRVNDVIATEDGPQTLVGRFMYGPLDMVTLTGEKVK